MTEIIYGVKNVKSNMSWEGGSLVVVQQPKGTEMQDICTVKQRQQKIRRKLLNIITRDDMEPRFRF